MGRFGFEGLGCGLHDVVLPRARGMHKKGPLSSGPRALVVGLMELEDHHQKISLERDPETCYAA